MNEDLKPSWHKLGILLLFIVMALFLVSTMQFSPFAHKLLLTGMMVLGYTLVGFWVLANAAALEEEARRNQPQRRQPWHPEWWRPGLNSRQRNYLRVKHGAGRRPS